MSSQDARLRARFEFQKNETIDQLDFILSRDTNLHQRTPTRPPITFRAQRGDDGWSKPAPRDQIVESANGGVGWRGEDPPCDMNRGPGRRGEVGSRLCFVVQLNRGRRGRQAPGGAAERSSTFGSRVAEGHGSPPHGDGGKGVGRGVPLPLSSNPGGRSGIPRSEGRRPLGSREGCRDRPGGGRSESGAICAERASVNSGGSVPRPGQRGRRGRGSGRLASPQS